MLILQLDKTLTTGSEMEVDDREAGELTSRWRKLIYFEQTCFVPDLSIFANLMAITFYIHFNLFLFFYLFIYLFIYLFFHFYFYLFI